MEFGILLARLALAAALAASAATAHCAAADAEDAPCRHAYAFLGEPKLPPGFEHFDWVNPDAPKGGFMRMADTGSWDTFNRMALGHSVRGMDTRGNSTRHIYDSLVIRNPTEIATIYGVSAGCAAAAPPGAGGAGSRRAAPDWGDGGPR
ncbi:MAG: ABC transporter substrate-binding protein, partial [Gammaproteobacteria bacterium]|nr:ABC transporter substrate-binding protein [Gammaproteobacteria bacterium]